jgi:hypothetical protein
MAGPGKHLKGLTLMDGLVTPEEFDYFREYFSLSRFTATPVTRHSLTFLQDELIITQEFVRFGARGYGDGAYAVYQR